VRDTNGLESKEEGTVSEGGARGGELVAGGGGASDSAMVRFVLYWELESRWDATRRLRRAGS
jgi:hypothetical protein